MGLRKGSVFHRWIWQKLKDKCLEDNLINFEIPREKVCKILCNSHVPKKLHSKFLKEMQKQQLIKIINKRRVKIIDEIDTSWFG